jgi:hypothetical protein
MSDLLTIIAIILAIIGVLINIYFIQTMRQRRRFPKGEKYEEYEETVQMGERHEASKGKYEKEILGRDEILTRLAIEKARFQKVVSELNRPAFTIVYPEIVQTQNWYSVEIFIYLKKYAKVVEREITKLRQKDYFDYGEITSQFPKSLPKGCKIKVIFSSDVFEINPEKIYIKWFEEFYKLPFRIRCIHNATNRTHGIIDVDIFADDLPIASLQLSIAISDTVKAANTVSSDAQWIEEIFASYARGDLKIVKHLKERYKALGIYMFVDLDDLRSGAMWQRILFEKIESSDLFQLFWSNSAKKSKSVEIEWRKALELSLIKGARFIRPLFWETPMPLVPHELSGLHFYKLDFIDEANV